MRTPGFALEIEAPTAEAAGALHLPRQYAIFGAGVCRVSHRRMRVPILILSPLSQHMQVSAVAPRGRSKCILVFQFHNDLSDFLASGVGKAPFWRKARVATPWPQ